jgi:hypothetical protein
MCSKKLYDRKGAEEMRGFGLSGSCAETRKAPPPRANVFAFAANLKMGVQFNNFRLLSISDADLYLIHMAYDLGKSERMNCLSNRPNMHLSTFGF